MVHWYPSYPESDCLAKNLAGYPYEEFSCLYPSLGWTYVKWEVNYDPVPVRDWMLHRPWVPVVAIAAYLVLITAGPAYFNHRAPWNARRLLAAWNLSLSLFSLVGFVRVFPAIVHNFMHYSWRDNFCFDPESHFGSGSTGLWVQLFILSKFPELMDTVFIVVHKKPLIFLHWYHHVSVLAYCWISYTGKSPTGLVFCFLNYGVHAIMYGYYFLMAIGCKPKWFNPMVITLAQISQMVVGVAVTVIGWYLLVVEQRPDCMLTRDNNLAALVMYGSYLVLFLQFFLQRYFGKKKSKRSASKEKAAVNGTSKVNGVNGTKKTTRRKEE